ncbi:MAG: hypothetical protein ACFFER_20355, partial [Candidatus Thorarchaeota archaeon]
MSSVAIYSQDDHAGFYTAFGISLALILFPIYSELIQTLSVWIIPVESSILALAGVSGAITAILYIWAPDKYADSIINRVARYNGIREKESYDSDFMSGLAEIDILASNWYKPSWLSTKDSCKTMIDASVDSPAIQKIVWKMKRRTGIGILFCLWSVSLLFIASHQWLYLLIGLLFGTSVIAYTLFWGESTKLVSKVRALAYISYANDSLQNWQPSSRLKPNDPIVDSMQRLRDAASNLENIAKADQWDRFVESRKWY